MAEDSQDLDVGSPLALTVRKTAGGASFAVDAFTGWTVARLKTAVAAAAADAPPDAQRLIYKGRVLKDGDTLEGAFL